MKYINKILDLMDASPTPFHVIKNNVEQLKAAGFVQLHENQDWNISKGGKYFISRNQSSIIAFKIPDTTNINGFMIAASHSDYPCFKLRSNPEIKKKRNTLLSVEPYASPLFMSWVDCPLSVAGRVFLKMQNGFFPKIVNIDRPLLMIPGLSTHQSDSPNTKGKIFEPSKDLKVFYGDQNAKPLIEAIAQENNFNIDDVLDSELFLYRYQKPTIWGSNNEYFSARAIDDQLCVYSSLKAIIESEPTNSIAFHVVFDCEEIGSSHKQGANSNMFEYITKRICTNLNYSNEDYQKMLCNSYSISADNGHAFHVNYPEVCDDYKKTYLGCGPVIKYDAKYSYSTDGISSSISKKIAEKCNIKLQEYYNRPGERSGGTLARFFIPKTGIMAADIGLAQLAMHSSYETCSTQDIVEMKNFIREAFCSTVIMESDSTYIFK